jgi:hypothetical protein
MTYYDHGRPSIQNRTEMDEAREKKTRGPPAPEPKDADVPEDLLYLYEALRTEQDPDAQASIEQEIREKTEKKNEEVRR